MNDKIDAVLKEFRSIHMHDVTELLRGQQQTIEELHVRLARLTDTVNNLTNAVEELKSERNTQ